MSEGPRSLTHVDVDMDVDVVVDADVVAVVCLDAVTV